MPTFPANLDPASAPGLPAPHRLSVLSKAAVSLLAILFPTGCPICGRELHNLSWISICNNCWDSLSPWEGACCSYCGLPFASAQPESSTAPLCAACRNEAWGFNLARSYGVYTFPLRDLILELKFRRRERWGQRLGGLLASLWPGISSRLLEPRPLLVPVPLHPTRQRERGFNQAELLAQGLCAKLKQSGAQPPRLDRTSVRRALATRPQSGLNPRTRFENVRGAFIVSRPERARNHSVVLIDDVMTTGATLSACAYALKQAGARQVLALTLARATPQFPVTALPAPPIDEPMDG